MGEGRDGFGDLDSARRRRDGGDGTGRDEKTREVVRTLDFSNAGGESVGWDGGDAAVSYTHLTLPTILLV